ncbi:hypothetical protein F6X40_24210 [Paraburkholderia sp. UCT31]|uniref:hypothetical protein n=1 Tax=Paraburkholderia sp. UCT31 TaxID=2615209 RepID=UPI0016552625|nr:hypothetical protein [Paraburkholderia sp. UCT31]MBC8739821.1 hypothetical protein [Paraburkholderia sp. UCT31]
MSVTAVILLGASQFPEHGGYEANPSFLRSKQDFRAYLQDADNGLGIPDENILDLFDSNELPPLQLVAIGDFLDGFSQLSQPGELRNLIVYYVGHGFFCGMQQEYHLAVASIRMNYESPTGLRIVDLAENIKQHASAYRRFIFLDCCFAAEAFKVFQGAAAQAIARNACDAFADDAPRFPQETPPRGTALFCAASKDHVAKSPSDAPRTVFAEGLLEVLTTGDRYAPPELTLYQLEELTWKRIRDKFPTSMQVKPEVHSPDQSAGNIASRVSLFPNAYRTHTQGERPDARQENVREGPGTIPAKPRAASAVGRKDRTRQATNESTGPAFKSRFDFRQRFLTALLKLPAYGVFTRLIARDNPSELATQTIYKHSTLRLLGILFVLEIIFCDFFLNWSNLQLTEISGNNVYSILFLLAGVMVTYIGLMALRISGNRFYATISTIILSFVFVMLPLIIMGSYIGLNLALYLLFVVTSSAICVPAISIGQKLNIWTKLANGFISLSYTAPLSDWFRSARSRQRVKFIGGTFAFIAANLMITLNVVSEGYFVGSNYMDGVTYPDAGYLLFLRFTPVCTAAGITIRNPILATGSAIIICYANWLAMLHFRWLGLNFEEGKAFVLQFEYVSAVCVVLVFFAKAISWISVKLFLLRRPTMVASRSHGISLSDEKHEEPKENTRGNSDN